MYVGFRVRVWVDVQSFLSGFMDFPVEQLDRLMTGHRYRWVLLILASEARARRETELHPCFSTRGLPRQARDSLLKDAESLAPGVLCLGPASRQLVSSKLPQHAIYIYIYIYTPISMYLYIYIYTHISIYIHTYIYIHIYIYTYLFIFIFVFIFIYLYLYLCLYL